MEITTANSVSRYIKTLYDINQRCIILCGTVIFNTSIDHVYEILEISREIMRLIPYSSNNGSLYIERRDGLLEFSEELPYLQEDFETILKNNYCFLEMVKKIRNKYEHSMHVVKNDYSFEGGKELLEVSFLIKEQRIFFRMSDCIKLMKQLNALYDQIRTDVMVFAEDNGKMNYPFYANLRIHEFSNFNEVYDSKMLKIIGNTMSPY